MFILKDMDKPETVRFDHWLNMIDHTRNPKKIEQDNIKVLLRNKLF
jgi:hypothetical protein